MSFFPINEWQQYLLITDYMIIITTNCNPKQATYTKQIHAKSSNLLTEHDNSVENINVNAPPRLHALGLI
jgi:hypothetical protein